MHIAIDLIIAAVMVAVIINAAKRGFVSSLFGLVTVALSLIAAIAFYRELGLYINERFVFDAIEPRIAEYAKAFVAENSELSVETLQSVLPSDVASLLGTFGIDIASLFESIGAVPEALSSAIAEELSLALSNAIAFGTLFVASFVLLSLICLILNLIVKLPVLKGVNKFLGVVFGIVEAAVLGIVIAKIAAALCGAYGSFAGDTAIAGVIDETVVAKFLLLVNPW